MVRMLSFLALLAVFGPAARADEAIGQRTVEALKRLGADPDRGVRYAVANALGKAGRNDLLGALREDPEPCVREEAIWWEEVGAKQALLPPHVPARFPPTNRVPRGLRVELEPGMGWRDRRRVLQGLAGTAEDAHVAAGLLVDPVYAVRAAAYEALFRIGPVAAGAVADQMATGDYGALHHGDRLFDNWGEAGAAAVPTLAALLAHTDLNAREYAARALRSIGPAAQPATEALVRALGDRRLCVTAHASLALGRIGLSEPLLGAMSDERARVRAYAASAVGWALGEVRGIDQVAFEHRLPVISVEAPGAVRPVTLAEVLAEPDEDGTEQAAYLDLLRDALWSHDQQTAIAAAVRLNEKQLDVLEAERVMELTVADAVREGSAVDFEHFRSILGSSELGAFLAFASRILPEKRDRRSTEYSQLHRIGRAEHMHLLHWHARHDPEGVFAECASDLWIAAGYTDAHTRLRAAYRLGRDPGASLSEVVRAQLEPTVEAHRRAVAAASESPFAWGLKDTWAVAACRDPSLGPLLAEVGRILIEDVSYARREADLCAVARALAHAEDPASLALLQRLVDEDKVDLAGPTALGALAARGDAVAQARLVVRSRHAFEALLILMERRPAVATAVLAERATHWRKAREVGELFDRNWQYFAWRGGARPDMQVFDGIEAAILANPPEGQALLTLFRHLPGCQTERIAGLVIDAIEADDTLFVGEEYVDAEIEGHGCRRRRRLRGVGARSAAVRTPAGALR